MAELKNPKINDVIPREVVGRDVIARFQAQFRGAAFKSLEILEGGPLDRVYCDFHDDYVARESLNGDTQYHFYQVKTKAQKNYQYSLKEIFGLYKARGVDKQNAEHISKSFAGLLILHAVNFKNSCGSVNFQTNIQFKDDTEALINAIKDNDLENKHHKLLIGKYRECFACSDEITDSEITLVLNKLVFEAGLVHLHPDDTTFPALAREAIFKFSEVDLKSLEAKRIISNLISLVEEKSFKQIIGNLTEAELDDKAGIGIADLLSLLSISKGAYDRLVAGGDAHAIRNVSIIQRKLGEAGATEEMVEYASSCKAEWDTWVRSRRHYISELQYNVFLKEFDDVVKKWIGGIIPMATIEKYVNTIIDDNADSSFSQTLSQNLVLGGLLARVVKNEVQ